ncbi:unnamed protein product [Diplocarpon coronariae]
MRTLYVGPTHLYGTRRHGTLTLPVRPTPDTPPARLSFGYLSQGQGEKGGHHPTPDLLVYPGPSTPRLTDLPLGLSSPLFAVVGTRDASRSREWEWDGMVWPADGQEMATGPRGGTPPSQPDAQEGGMASCECREHTAPRGPREAEESGSLVLSPWSQEKRRRAGRKPHHLHPLCARREKRKKEKKEEKRRTRGTGTTTTGRPIGASWCEDSPISFLSPPVNPSHGHGLLLLWKVRSFALRVHLADAWPPPSWREAVLHRASRPQFLIFSPLVWLASCVL